MQECEEGDKVIRGSEGRREGEVDEPWGRAGRDRYSEDGCVDEGERVERCRDEDGREGRTVPPSQAASAKKELLTWLEGLSKALKVMQLGQYTINKLDAEDEAPACHLHEGRVRAARGRGKGDK
eukprot:2897067-Pleurochrysis_carterae.AAC.1